MLGTPTPPDRGQVFIYRGVWRHGSPSVTAAYERERRQRLSWLVPALDRVPAAVTFMRSHILPKPLPYPPLAAGTLSASWHECYNLRSTLVCCFHALVYEIGAIPPLPLPTSFLLLTRYHESEA